VRAALKSLLICTDVRVVSVGWRGAETVLMENWIPTSDLLRKASHRGWGAYAVMSAYCFALVVQDYRGQMGDKLWPYVIGPLALFLAQLAYPTLLGWLLSVFSTATLGLVVMTDPLNNLGPGREFGLIWFMFCGFVYRHRPKPLIPPQVA
jgi:hypothetical protein